MEIKTTQEIKEYNPIRGQSYRVEQKFRNKQWVAVDDIVKIIEEMKQDCSNCYTGLTKDSDFENAFATMSEIVFKEFDKLTQQTSDEDE